MFTDKLAKDTDSFVSSTLVTILNVDFTKPRLRKCSNPTLPQIELLSVQHMVAWDGAALTKRYLALNSLINVMPQAIDRRTNAGFIVSGLWNSLGDVLGAG